MRPLAKLATWIGVAGVLTAMAGCGGGGGGGTKTTPPTFPVRIVTSFMPNGVKDAPYSTTLQASGGSGTKTWSLASGTLPTGLTLDANAGSISGVPTQATQMSFTVRVTDSSGTDTADFGIHINPPLVITTASIPDGMVGQQFFNNIEAAGGSGGPYSFELLTSLPVGTDLASTGVISGTPIQSGSFIFVVRATDNAAPPQTVDKQFSWLIGPAALKISSPFLPSGSVAHAYGAVLAAINGTPPYTWSVNPGTLPDGLALDAATGEITGSPTTAGTSDFTIVVSDSVAASASKPFSIVVGATPLGRNNSVATATPISNGVIHASLSPFGDPPDVSAPDTDYYKVAANAGQIVTVETFARRLAPPSMADTVVIIVQSNGARYSGCDGGAGNLDGSCLSDDIDLGVVLDSRLRFLVPGTPGTPVTFYIRVLDWSGNARPDLLYDLSVNGVN